jgi:hypothetical protein
VVQENLADLSCDIMLKQSFNSTDFAIFWLSTEQEYPTLVIEVLKKIIPFASTYLCKSAFSAMTAIKTKYRN